MDCPKCQTSINIRKRMACEKCGYNFATKQTKEEQELAIAQKPKPKPKPEERTVWGWYVKCWKEFFNFQGRARRMEYWSFQLINIFVLLPLLALWLIFGRGMNAFMILAIIYYVAIIIPNLAVTIRRLHDSGKSGWWLLFTGLVGMVSGFIPIFIFPIISAVLGLLILVFMFLDSEYGTNNWGESPKYPNGWKKVERGSDKLRDSAGFGW